MTNIRHRAHVRLAGMETSACRNATRTVWIITVIKILEYVFLVRLADMVITVRTYVQLVVREEHAIRHPGAVNVQRDIILLCVPRSVKATVLVVVSNSVDTATNVWKVIMEKTVHHHVQKTVKVNVRRTLGSVTSVEKVIMEINVSRSAATTV